MAMILKLYGTRGGAVLSGYSICTTGTDIFFTLLSGMSIATTVVISHPLGANKLDEARRNGYHMMGFSFVLASVFAVFMYATSYVFPSLYSTVSDEVMEIAQTMIRVQSVFFILVTLNMQNYFIVRAGGDTKSTLLMDSGFMWCVNISLLAILAYFTDMNIYMMYIVGQSTDIIKLFLSNRLVRKEKWVVNLTEGH